MIGSSWPWHMKMHSTVQSLSCSQGQSVTDRPTHRRNHSSLTIWIHVYLLCNATCLDNKVYKFNIYVFFPGMTLVHGCLCLISSRVRQKKRRYWQDCARLLSDPPRGNVQQSKLLLGNIIIPPQTKFEGYNIGITLSVCLSVCNFLSGI